MGIFKRLVCLFSSVVSKQNTDSGATIPIIPGQDSSRRKQLSYREPSLQATPDRVPQPQVLKSRSLDATVDPALKERRRREKKVARHLERSATGSYSIISLDWMSQWGSFLRGGVLPGPISLAKLKDKHGAMKHSRLMGVDFTLVTRELAEYLLSVYGGDAPMPADAQVQIPEEETPRIVPPVIPPALRRPERKVSEPKITPWREESPIELTQPSGETTPVRSSTLTTQSTLLAKKTSLASSSTPENDRDKGLVGLENPGLVCYLNATVQCLLSLPQIKDWALQQQVDPKRKFCAGFGLIARGVFESEANSSISSAQFTALFSKRFSPRKMHDSVEFLIYLLDHLDRELVSKLRPMSVGDSWSLFTASHSAFLVENFAGALRSEVSCAACGHTSKTLDPFTQLDLPLAKSVSSALEEFIQREPLSPAFVCPGCSNAQDSTRRISFQKCPKSLILTLKRFQSQPAPEKLNQFVTFHKKIDLSKYSEGHQVLYQLQSVIVHSGDMEAGHYVAYCKRGHSWYMFNDNLVQGVKLKEVLMQQAYVLLYSIEPSS